MKRQLGWRLNWNRPEFYTYQVADSGFRVVRNILCGIWIGQLVVVGSTAYCIRWGHAAPVWKDTP